MLIMSNLKNDILIIKGMTNYTSLPIPSLPKEYPAILYKEPNEYGVAFNFNDVRDIKYKFVNVILESRYIGQQKILYLHSKSIIEVEKYAMIAECFLDPKNREYILNNPYDWCEEWKNIFGNAKKKMLVSDLIAELITYKELLKNNKNVSWGASEKTTHDFEMPDFSVEVKSTINKTNTIVSINSSYQLKGDKPIYLYFCRLEKVKFKNTINSLIKDLVNMGVDESVLEAELFNLGYQKGVKERDESFDILEIRSFDISKGVLPVIDLDKLNKFAGTNNIIAYRFELDLSGVEYTKVL